MSQDGLFSGGSENVIRWVSVAGIVLALIAIALILTVLARRPVGRDTPIAKWTLLVGFFVLPSITMLLGNVVGFHKVKQSCGECHTMDPWVQDMKNPESQSLAAKHYKNRWINEDQCYTCHTGYGLGGNIEAKKGGLGHVIHYYITGVPEEIKIKKPFPRETCFHCHANAASFLKVEQHVDPEFKPKIMSGEMSCFECHETPHPKRKK